MQHTTFDKKNTLVVRADMHAHGIRPQLHLQHVGPNEDRFYMPDASYVLTTEDKKKVLRVLKSLRTPTNYVLTLHKKTHKGKLSGLNHTTFMFCFRKVSNKSLENSIILLNRVFRKLCAKIINGEEIEQLVVDSAETMCMLEMIFPPLFLDIMSYLPNH